MSNHKIINKKSPLGDWASRMAELSSEQLDVLIDVNFDGLRNTATIDGDGELSDIPEISFDDYAALAKQYRVALKKQGKRSSDTSEESIAVRDRELSDIPESHSSITEQCDPISENPNEGLNTPDVDIYEEEVTCRPNARCRSIWKDIVVDTYHAKKTIPLEEVEVISCPVTANVSRQPKVKTRVQCLEEVKGSQHAESGHSYPPHFYTERKTGYGNTKSKIFIKRGR